jgi:hypothetical protein
MQQQGQAKKETDGGGHVEVVVEPKNVKLGRTTERMENVGSF